MQTSECFHELRSIEARSPLRELLILPQMVEELASVEEVHHKVELCWCLESVVKLDDKWTVNLLQDVSFS